LKRKFWPAHVVNTAALPIGAPEIKLRQVAVKVSFADVVVHPKMPRLKMEK
jgi:hypothetical protein